jgi:hypothetical protein
MKERPILFSGPMVRAIQEGLKTQTRRIVKPQPKPGLPGQHPEHLVRWRRNKGETNCRIEERWENGKLESRREFYLPVREWLLELSPWKVGQRLWVRETWAYSPTGFDYRADCELPPCGNEKWRPSIHMPRKASRLSLELTDVRAERLQEITESDATAEGFSGVTRDCKVPYFARLWDEINGKGSWDDNDYVYVLTFKKL